MKNTKEKEKEKIIYHSPYAALPSIEELVTANPEDGFELAQEVETISNNFLTIENSAMELESLAVSTLMELMERNDIAPKDRLAAVKETTEILGKKTRANHTINLGENIQVNQITSPEISGYLAKSTENFKQLTTVKVNDIKTSEGGRG